MKLSRNDPCSCGSGKKYKHCCLNSNYAAPELPIDVKAHDGAIDKSMTWLSTYQRKGWQVAFSSLFEQLLSEQDRQVTGLKLSTAGETRTLYSLRHSSIMFRLMFGRTVDTLTLARNARTSPEMIDRFYAAPLQGEMNVGELQSKRRPRPWE